MNLDRISGMIKKTMESVLKNKKAEKRRARKLAIREMLMEPTLEDRQREARLWVKRKISHGVR